MCYVLGEYWVGWSAESVWWVGDGQLRFVELWLVTGLRLTGQFSDGSGQEIGAGTKDDV